MARRPLSSPEKEVIVRMAAPEFDALRDLVFSRYPDREWATFARFGWIETPSALVLTLASLDTPGPGDMNERAGNVQFYEPYTLRMALNAENHRLAVGVIHSHPEDYIPLPSSIDDDMDTYYADYFFGFTQGRPYISLIMAMDRGELVISGRVHFQGKWLAVTRFAIERTPHTLLIHGHDADEVDLQLGRVARLATAFGEQAAARLRNSRIAVIGAGGTGSAAIEVLARAGVGTLIVVDPDHFEESNLERVHGSVPADVEQRTSKVELARRHVKSIDPTIHFIGCIGALPQQEVVDQVLAADVILGCTDKQHSRLAISEMAWRYLVPAIDTGVVLEGAEGKVTGQVMQLTRFLSADPCAYCSDLIESRRITQELMSSEEKAQRQRAAQEAVARGEKPDPYWLKEPQINTVGYLTTAAAALGASYVIGWITGRFDPPFSQLQMNLVAKYFDVVDIERKHRPDCACSNVKGHADQCRGQSMISAPAHWPRARIS